MARILRALIASVTLLAGAAQAQVTPAPEHYTLDARGVDLIRGKYNHARNLLERDFRSGRVC